MKYLLLLTFFISTQLIAQPESLFPKEDLTALQAYEDTLGLMSHLVVNDSLEENRYAATKKMIKTLVQALKIDNSYHYPFEQIKTVSIQYPADSTFRIFTWQLYVNKDEYRYYGAVQMNSKKLELFPLIDRSAGMDNIEFKDLTPDEWYGNLVYNIQDFDTSEGKKYLLFGYDAYSFFERRKVMDVLHFQDGKPVFGAPVIQAPDRSGRLQLQNRFALTYSAAASIGLNFDEEENKVVYNHLTIGGPAYGGKPTLIPSGSYDGFALKDGNWIYEEEVFDFITPEGEYPRPQPVLDGRKQKNIFGQR